MTDARRPAKPNPENVPGAQPSGSIDVPTPAEALRALSVLARLDQMRGIRHWWDPELGAGLRDLVRQVGSTGSGAGTESPARKPAPAPGKPPVPRASADPSVPPVPPSPPTGRRTPPASAGPAGDTTAVGSAKAAGSPTGSSKTGTPGGSATRPQWAMPPLAIGRDPDWNERLEAVARNASSCVACALCKTRNKVVFGVGSAHVPLVFVGEAPGADEDRQGIPFVGKAGQLLTRIIAAIGLDRDEVYICNVLKCRPPGNRNPAPDEIAKCTPFLEEQMEILRPKVICTLGLFASQFLLETQSPIGKLRGRLFEYHGVPVIPTYHPAALLRNPALKAAVWEDVQLVRRTLDA
ncbi:MAG: uracil-DNA glycosylase [Candidatus Eisenbacteria bacterium]